jgi:hypothetical protein
MGRVYTVLLLGFLNILTITGCHELDAIVVPINNATIDLNQTEETFSMPTDLFPDTKIQMRGTKLAIEKNF